MITYEASDLLEVEVIDLESLPTDWRHQEALGNTTPRRQVAPSTIGAVARSAFGDCSYVRFSRSERRLQAEIARGIPQIGQATLPSCQIYALIPENAMPFVPISAPRLYQAVADQIAQLIRVGEYQVGNRLPPERDLSRRLGVSRPVVREAMIALEIAGLIEVRGGSGAYIRAAATPAHVPDAGDGPYEAFIARRALEGEIAAAAAETATAADIAELAAAIEQMRNPNQPYAAVDPGDRRFHLALAAATHNAVFAELIRFIWDELLNRGPIWGKLRERRAVRTTRVAEHQAILQAITNHDPDAARRAMHAHFEGAIRDFLEANAAGEQSSSSARPAA